MKVGSGVGWVRSHDLGKKGKRDKDFAFVSFTKEKKFFLKKKGQTT